MSELLPKRVVVMPGHVICAACGSVTLVGRYRHSEPHLTVECLAQHCADRGKVFKMPLPVLELERL